MVATTANQPRPTAWTRRKTSPILTHGQRGEHYLHDQERRLNTVLPFLGERYPSEAPGSISEYRI
jgi:hypothetical protein